MTGQAEIEVPVSAERAFAAFQDYSRRLHWDPFLCEARLLDASEPQIGVVARCVAKPRWLRLAMDTVYVTYSPPGQTAVRMVRGPWLVRNFAASLRHKPLEDGVSLVIYRYNLALRPSWLGRLLEPLLRLWFDWETRHRLKAFRTYLREGSAAL